MVNEEIITALRNSIENNESLEQAIQILINSGYNSQEITEASQFFSSGIINQTQPRPEEQLTMPEKKSFFSSFSSKKEKPSKPTSSNLGMPNITQTPAIYNTPNIAPSSVPVVSNFNQSSNLSQQLQQINKPKQSHFKEILLFAMLLILIGVLVLTMIYKSQIISYFS